MKTVHISLALLALAVFGCEKEPSKLEALVDAASTTPVAPKPTAAEPAKAPLLVIEANAVAVGPDRVMAGDTDFASKIAALVAGKPKIEGEEVEVTALRQAKPSYVTALIAGLQKAKAKSVILKTENRDKVAIALPVVFPKQPIAPCTVVALIRKDGGISVWTVGGKIATRLNRGFAGPDMTLGSEAVRKASSSCDSPLWLVGGEEALTWGLVFDLALASRAPAEAGAQMKAKDTAIVAGDVVPGRKVALAE